MKVNIPRFSLVWPGKSLSRRSEVEAGDSAAADLPESRIIATVAAIAPHDYVIKIRFPEAGVVQGFVCHTVVPSVVRMFSTNLLTSNSSWPRVSTTRRIGAL